MKTSEELAQGQLDAYNAHDIDTFCSFFAEDIRVYDALDHSLLMEGMKQFRARYRKTFANEKLHCTLVNRMVQGDIVIDQEAVVGFGADDEDEMVKAIAIYHTRDGLIREVHFY